MCVNSSVSHFRCLQRCRRCKWSDSATAKMLDPLELLLKLLLFPASSRSPCCSSRTCCHQLPRGSPQRFLQSDIALQTLKFRVVNGWRTEFLIAVLQLQPSPASAPCVSVSTIPSPTLSVNNSPTWQAAPQPHPAFYFNFYHDCRPNNSMLVRHNGVSIPNLFLSAP